MTSKYKNGPLIKTFIDNIIVNHKTTNPRKIYLYSAQDETMHPLLKAHNFSIPNRLVNFGSALIIEKYIDENNGIFLKVGI